MTSDASGFEPLWTKCGNLSLACVPAAGDLVKFSRLESHYRTLYPQEETLFTPATRPTSLSILYQAAAATITQVSWPTPLPPSPEVSAPLLLPALHVKLQRPCIISPPH
jgi:hypothetical protein